MADLAFQPISLEDAQQQAASFAGAPLPPPPAPGPLPGVPPQFAGGGMVPNPVQGNEPLPMLFSPSGGAPINPNPPPPPMLGPEFQQGGVNPPGAAPITPPAAPPARAGGGGRPKGPDELTRLDQNLQAAGQKEQQAVTEGGQAVAQAKEAEAGILEHAAGQEQQFAAEQAAKAKEVRQRQEIVDQQDAANLQKARDYVIPDFWQGKEGARVGSVLSVMGGAIAAGILGGPNGALQIINKQTDDYFHRQKQKIDNLYRYAEETGRLNAQIKLRYAQELVDLKDQHSAVLHSVATRLQAAALHTGSEEEKKNYLAAAAKIGTQVAEQRMKTPQERASIEAARASAAASYANAAESRAKIKQLAATGGVSPRVLLDISNQVQGQIAKDPEIKDTITSLHKYEEAQSALRSGTGIGDKLVIDEITKAATNLGARPQSIKVFEQATGGVFDRVKGEIQKLQTGKALSPEQSANVAKFLNYTINEKRTRLNSARDRVGTAFHANPAYAQNPQVIDAILDQHFGARAPASGGGGGDQLVTIRNSRTGETKQVTREQARAMGAI